MFPRQRRRAVLTASTFLGRPLPLGRCPAAPEPGHSLRPPASTTEPAIPCQRAAQSRVAEPRQGPLLDSWDGARPLWSNPGFQHLTRTRGRARGGGGIARDAPRDSHAWSFLFFFRKEKK